jgi:hypothetical protein
MASDQFSVLQMVSLSAFECSSVLKIEAMVELSYMIENVDDGGKFLFQIISKKPGGVRNRNSVQLHIRKNNRRSQHLKNMISESKSNLNTGI